MSDLIYGILRIQLRINLPSKNKVGPYERQKLVTLHAATAIGKDGAATDAVAIMRVNPSLKDAMLKVTWTPDAVDLTSEVLDRVS
jgi:hypothetical protein